MRVLEVFLCGMIVSALLTSLPALIPAIGWLGGLALAMLALGLLGIGGLMALGLIAQTWDRVRARWSR